MHLQIKSLARMLTAILLAMALSFSGPVALADDDDDVDNDDNSGAGAGYVGEPTAYLYEGTTEDFASAKVVDEIDDLDEDRDDDDDVWELIGNGQDRPDGLLSTEDDIDDDHNITVQSVVDGDYMVVVHADETTDSPIIAAGDIEGEVQDGTILIELHEVDTSGFEGRAFIHTDDDDDDDNDVEFAVGIYPAGSVELLPEPTPAG